MKGVFLLSLAIGGVAASSAQDLGALGGLSPDARSRLEKIAEDFAGQKGGNMLFYFPTRDEPATPRDHGLAYENVSFRSADGTLLHGWFMRSKNPRATGTVVFSHGNGGSMGHHLGFVDWLPAAGYHLFTYDYRGYGKSGGMVDRKGMVEDAQAAFRAVAKIAGVRAERIISYGHSLGGAKSVAAIAMQRPKGLRAVVVDASFASYQAMARVFAGDAGARIISDDLSPRDLVARISPLPLLVIHGTADEVVPFRQGRELFDKAGEPKTLFEVRDGNHGTCLSRDNGSLRKKVLSWLEEVLRRDGNETPPRKATVPAAR
jgi:fermentation-respiration switch protein FrsA (DUF1100 family)